MYIYKVTIKIIQSGNKMLSCFPLWRFPFHSPANGNSVVSQQLQAQ